MSQPQEIPARENPLIDAEGHCIPYDRIEFELIGQSWRLAVCCGRERLYVLPVPLDQLPGIFEGIEILLTKPRE